MIKIILNQSLMVTGGFNRILIATGIFIVLISCSCDVLYNCSINNRAVFITDTSLGRISASALYFGNYYLTVHCEGDYLFDPNSIVVSSDKCEAIMYKVIKSNSVYTEPFIVKNEDVVIVVSSRLLATLEVSLDGVLTDGRNPVILPHLHLCVN